MLGRPSQAHSKSCFEWELFLCSVFAYEGSLLSKLAEVLTLCESPFWNLGMSARKAVTGPVESCFHLSCHSPPAPRPRLPDPRRMCSG